MEDFQTGEETSFAVDEVSGIIKDVSVLTCTVDIFAVRYQYPTQQSVNVFSYVLVLNGDH